MDWCVLLVFCSYMHSELPAANPKTYILLRLFRFIILHVLSQNRFSNLPFTDPSYIELLGTIHFA